VAEAFKKASIRCVAVSRSTLGGLGLKKRIEKRKDLCVSPKYYVGYYKRINKEARTTKFIEVLTGK
jgi:intein-encoded DNA endonuclease-like protein